MTMATRLTRFWLRLALAGCICIAAFCDPVRAEGKSGDTAIRSEFQESLAPLPDLRTLNTRGTIYVPVYSRVRDSTNQTPVDVTATLRIDNSSDGKVIVINRIDYYSTAGKLVQQFLDQPIALRPFGAIEISVPPDQQHAATAANFIVGWSGSGPIAEPVIEAVMVGTLGNSSYSFVSQGRTIRTVGRSSRWFDFKVR